MLTDHKIIALVAEKIMGWKVHPGIEAVAGDRTDTYFSMFADDCHVRTPGSKSSHIWNPLTSSSDAGGVTEAMTANGWNCSMFTLDDGWHVAFDRKMDIGRRSYWHVDESLPRAISIAAMRAVAYAEMPRS